MNDMGDMCAKFYNYRVEVQMRGAGHIHGVIWVDLDEFEKKHLLKANQDQDSRPHILKEAFQYVNDENNPEDEPNYEEALVKFADALITCSLKNPQTRDVVEEVNTHHHTRKCDKQAKKCKYNFRKLPAVRTVIAVPARIKFKDPDERAKMQERCKSVLNKVKEVLDNDDSYNDLLNDIKQDDNDLDEYLMNKDVFERTKSILDDVSFSKQVEDFDDDVITGKNVDFGQQPIGKQLLENLEDLKSQSFKNLKEETLKERRKKTFINF